MSAVLVETVGELISYLQTFPEETLLGFYNQDSGLILSLEFKSETFVTFNSNVLNIDYALENDYNQFYATETGSEILNTQNIIVVTQ